jgi:membrane protease YdiL (CAAX protease family)
MGERPASISGESPRTAFRGLRYCAMLFTLKRRWTSALLGLACLSLIGLIIRAFQLGAPVELSARAVWLGLVVFALVLVSDAAIHGILCWLWAAGYRRRHRELALVFRGQSIVALLLGALMAGVGEELVFRGGSLSPIYLFGGAVVFGLLHHIRRELWPFTLWAVWQGVLFAAALCITEMLCVTMVAHFLHDCIGFLVFRYLNRVGSSAKNI